jgi:hypothetical protein
MDENIVVALHPRFFEGNPAIRAVRNGFHNW